MEILYSNTPGNSGPPLRAVEWNYYTPENHFRRVRTPMVDPIELSQRNRNPTGHGGMSRFVSRPLQTLNPIIPSSSRFTTGGMGCPTAPLIDPADSIVNGI